MIDNAVAEVKDDAAPARGHDLWKDAPAVIEQAMRTRGVYMSDNVATFEERKEDAKR
jgi:hypothetical protein